MRRKQIEVSKKNVWITGANGMLGTRLVKRAAEQHTFEKIYAFTHTYSAEHAPFPNVVWSVLDIGDKEAVLSAARLHPPDIIINTAAMTNVDDCELKQYDALSTNSYGVRYLAEISCHSGAHLLQISTDYVFSGERTQPGLYREDDTPHPINFYGQTKLYGEQAVLDLCHGKVAYTLVRTSQIYS